MPVDGRRVVFLSRIVFQEQVSLVCARNRSIGWLCCFKMTKNFCAFGSAFACRCNDTGLIDGVHLLQAMSPGAVGRYRPLRRSRTADWHRRHKLGWLVESITIRNSG